MFFLLGIVTGTVGSMGIGGGSILVPLAGLFSNLGQAALQGLNLLAFVPSASAAAFIYAREKRLRFRLVKKMALLALLGAAAGAAVALFAVDQAVLRRVYGGFLLSVGIWQWIAAEKRHKFERNMEKSGGMKKP
jgi:uncharacterized membrane protein YfcA